MTLLQKHYFEKEKRAFNSGCIRVADAEKLVRYLLQTQDGWSEEKISRQLTAKGTICKPDT